ncbi:hypothetical protein Goklo_024303 [Gossypium klotzschianum]|uniref:Uncharacterized protein n=1 Tax=Gossypium klotzschianum TaxID=34286 RepID=A0A7J8WCF3_9ROSI|nr:hypothetical protein [Gossypium klotzschianum]
MKVLESLNLSTNNLASEIPKSMSSLIFSQCFGLIKQQLIWKNDEFFEPLCFFTGMAVGFLAGFWIVFGRRAHFHFHLCLALLFALFAKATNWLQVIQSHPSLLVLHFEKCDFAEVDPSSLVHFNSSNSLSVLHLIRLSTFHPSAFPLLLNISQNLVELDLSYSYFPSLIPDTFDNMPSLEGINLEGRIPKTLGNLCTLKELNLQENSLSGPLTFAVKNLSGCAKDSLEVLKLDFNHFNRSLPSFVPFSSLRELDVGYNQLRGHFEDNFGDFSKLNVLNLDENRFTGPLPDLSRLSSLRELSLRGNRFEGPLPLSIGKMSKLELLDVSNNSLHGVISEAYLSNLTKLQFLSLSFNALSFHPSSDWIPEFQLYFIGLSSCELGPQFPSVEQEYQRTLGLLKSIDLSSNILSGEIPQEIASLKGLITLNLSRNTLSGCIIREIGQLKAMESLDLSTNNLSGEISKSMSDLSFLRNPRLCRTPLKKCPGDELPKSPKNSNIENRSESGRGLFEPVVFETWIFSIGEEVRRLDQIEFVTQTLILKDKSAQCFPFDFERQKHKMLSIFLNMLVGVCLLI